jgi:hypothetical protein
MKVLMVFALVALLALQANAECGAYNPSFQICCNGVLQNKGSNNACCNTAAYPSSSFLFLDKLLSYMVFNDNLKF